MYVSNLCAEFGYCRALEEWEYGNFRYAELKENYHETDMLAYLKENSYENYIEAVLSKVSQKGMY